MHDLKKCKGLKFREWCIDEHHILEKFHIIYIMQQKLYLSGLLYLQQYTCSCRQVKEERSLCYEEKEGGAAFSELARTFL